MSGDGSRLSAQITVPVDRNLSWPAMAARHRHVLALFSAAAVLLVCPVLRAQGTPTLTIDKDCSAFDISPQNDIVVSVPRLKFIKKYILERDDIWIASSSGKTDRIVDAEKFMPIPPLQGYAVKSLSWSPDGKRIAVNMTLQQPPARLVEEMERKKHKDKKKRDENPDDDTDNGEYQSPKGPPGGNAVALLDDDGHEIQVSGSKSRFIEGASNAAWLPGDQFVVYMSGDQIVRARPADGATTKLFEGHTFQAVAWDAPRNRAFAVGEDLTIRGGLVLVELDLLHERVTPIASLQGYRSALTVSSAGNKVGFFENGDTIEVIDIANPGKPVRVHAGLGIFQFSGDEKRVLLKRGPENQSNDLVWVGLHNDSFSPALQDLEYRAFQIAPDGNSIAVTQPGKRVLMVYPLE